MGYTMPLAGSTDFGQQSIIAADSEEGRIIALVPTPTIQSTVRLAEPAHEELQRLADKLGKSRPEVLELAIIHLSGTLRAGQPVYLDPPPEPPGRHKRARRVA